MSELSPDASINEREMQIKSALENLGGDAGDVEALSGPFEELRGKLTQAEARVAEEQRRTEEALRQLRTTEESLARLGEEYATLLEKKIAQESEDNETASTLQELTAKLEAQFKNKLERRESEIETFQKELMRKEDALSSLQEQLHTEREAGATLRATVEQLKAGARELIPEDLQRKEMELERIRKQMAQQLADFDNMKKKLMQNLQQRVDKVIEMEISLDETREQYNNVIRSASTKEQQRKMTFLERNLEQLMSVQKEVGLSGRGSAQSSYRDSNPIFVCSLWTKTRTSKRKSLSQSANWPRATSGSRRWKACSSTRRKSSGRSRAGSKRSLECCGGSFRTLWRLWRWNGPLRSMAVSCRARGALQNRCAVERGRRRR